MWQKLKPYILPVCGVALFGTFLIRSNPERVNHLKSEYEIFAVPPLADIHPRLLPIFVLGQKALYDDFISIWLLQTLVDKRSYTNPEDMMKAIRGVIRHEPKLETTYSLACFVMMNDLKSPESCREIIEAGIRAFPTSWQLPVLQGYVEYARLNQPAQAASFFMIAASRPEVPEYIKRSAAKLLNTRNPTAEDIASSIAVINEYGGDDQFMGMLRSINAQKITIPSSILPTPDEVIVPEVGPGLPTESNPSNPPGDAPVNDKPESGDAGLKETP